MGEDRSLDDFAQNADADRNDADARSGGENPRDDTGSEASESVAEASETVTATATWTTDGADCEQCGESVARRWRDGDALVCADCKDWSG
ncbi:DUF7573 domain-containing protein [Halorubrum laminariae]|uniref:DUF7573 domain-containing protein n=1 Tax=Halorubrum laminariae TaxID=1433523 RepID=A0ABD6BXS1_9EURY|nr:hypothetical protein [Halorubrum laminariae]